MKDSEVLRKVKKVIKSREQDYICHAIAQVAGEHTTQYNSLKAWVLHMLDGSISYGGWLSRKHEQIYDRMTWKQQQEGRLQWLDWMITECEKAEANEHVPTAKLYFKLTLVA